MRTARIAFALALLSSCHPSVEQYCRDFYDALAAAEERCGEPADLSEHICSQLKAYNCPSAQRLLDEGKISFDSSAGERCLAQIAASSCTLATSVDAPCFRAIVGQVAAGGACYDGRECAQGTRCLGSTCPATCTTLRELGSGCVDATECELGSFCASQVCVPPVGEAQVCGGASPPCADGLWCGTLSSKCRSTGALTSGPCEGPQDCAQGFICQGLDTSVLQSGTCTAAKSVGDACAPGECQQSFCKSGTCSEMPRVGGACGLVGGDLADCLASFCKLAPGDSTGTCANDLAIGQACSPGDSCGIFGTCDLAGSTCVSTCSPP
jgi:hypothetical protein